MSAPDRKANLRTASVLRKSLLTPGRFTRLRKAGNEKPRFIKPSAQFGCCRCQFVVVVMSRPAHRVP